ncbi:extracellular calcium-sensing receptor-like [Protopterus annectens]|uniref:extracellular calcium-sensing receptor-like n=1 Tax=Protopterus annectens TaxID=7888 RepID=UPI001CFB5CCC|nr:extracellular calcium-sensing receptor-like [Protopterus annectens]
MKPGHLAVAGLVMRLGQLGVAGFVRLGQKHRRNRLDTIPYQEILTIVFATEEINSGEILVPNYNCNMKMKLPAIIAEEYSSATASVARVLGIYRFPQVSHGAGLPLLSDKVQFPSFVRTVVNTYSQPLGHAEFTKHFGWTWVGIIYGDNDFSVQGSQQLKEALRKAHVCVAFYEVLPTDLTKKRILSLVETITQSSATVVIIYAYAPEVALLMEEITVQNISGKVWIAPTSWITDSILSKKELWKTLNGTIGLTSQSGEIPGFKDFLSHIHPSKYPHDIYMKAFWEAAFHCRWKNNETVRLIETDDKMPDITFCTGKEKLDTLEQTLFHYLKKVNFRNKAAQEIYFDANGDVPVIFDIINWQLTSKESMKSVIVGRYKISYDGSQILIINESAITWSGGYLQLPFSRCSNSCSPGYRKAPIRGLPICCYDCVSCSDGEIANETDATDCIRCLEDSWPGEQRITCLPKLVEYLSYNDPLGVTLTSVTILLSAIPCSILLIFILYRDTPIVRANNRNLSYCLLVALTFCFLCSLIFIGKPSHMGCLLRQSAFGTLFSACVSTILAKTITVLIAFNATKPGGFQTKLMGFKTPYVIGVFCSILQVGICTVWLKSSSPFPEKNKTTYKDKIIIECNEGSIVMFYCMLGYLGLLAIVCFVVAFLVRKLPDRYNEAKFITFSMIIFVSVWLSFVPAYLSTKGKYVVAVEIFAIISSGFGLLSCIFFPKCFIILLRPDMNTVLRKM